MLSVCPQNNDTPELQDYYYPLHISKFTVREPRSLRSFKRPQEVLRAVRDALSAHRDDYLTAFKIHGGITVDTICIGARPTAPWVQGFLKKSSPRTDDPTFKSFKSLEWPTLCRKGSLQPEIDYLDELESFYYVLAWMCYSYDCDADGKKYCIHPGRRAAVLTSWTSYPTSREAALEKEAMLFGTGIDYTQARVSEFWGGEHFEKMLDNLHKVIRTRYLQRKEFGPPLTMEKLRAEAKKDYRACLRIIQKALLDWERRSPRVHSKPC